MATRRQRCVALAVRCAADDHARGGPMSQPVIDAWAQRPSQRFLDEPWLASLNRWTRQDTLRAEVTVDAMVGHLDEAAVERAMVCAWCGPKGWLISHDEVAALCAERPERF